MCPFCTRMGFFLSKGVTIVANSIPAPPLWVEQCSRQQSKQAPARRVPLSKTADTSQEGTLEKALHSPTQT